MRFTEDGRPDRGLFKAPGHPDASGTESPDLLPTIAAIACATHSTATLTEVDVLRAFGEEPTLPSLLRRRDELLSLLRAALEP